MARLPLVALSDMPVALQDAVDRGQRSRMLSSVTPVQVWAHRPKAALAWLGLMENLHNDSLLPERLRELVRLKIASINTCQACQLARKSDTVTEQDIACMTSDSAWFSPPERAALRYAELFASDYLIIDDQLFSHLKRFFSAAQIAELGMYCALMLAGGRMTLVQQAY
ncbi:carboxymuconolactone decarboxylase family protein [Pseudomonas asiatica]|uniref:carboxymuconolactone decarboxylase family protein n=1 Tax=Pseudomonas asiatica TaxID=2219225 RepID=UPI0023674FB6|nr:carboxymuconolactone decarboxylase family protein [Pseudomonas asiatica]WDM86030.1 carboxymuconolactone decarboxylase family protein [Pseudomonas asiatica]